MLTDFREALRGLRAGKGTTALAFAILTLTLAAGTVTFATGIYGTMAFVVARQARAIGLCVALGASRAAILRSILSESSWRVGAGVALGVIGARAVATLFTSLVFGVTPTSPAVYASVALGLATMGLLAALLPARRASRLDPLTALRAE